MANRRNWKLTAFTAEDFAARAGYAHGQRSAQPEPVKPPPLTCDRCGAPAKKVGRGAACADHYPRVVS